MDNNKRELFEQFGSITGCKTNRKISHYLEACDFDLAMAVDLYFAQEAGGAPPQDDDVTMLSDDEEECVQGPSRVQPTRTSKVQQLKNGKNGYHQQQEAPVRAPIPSTMGTMIEAPYSAQYAARQNGRPISDNAFNQRADYQSMAVEQERIPGQRYEETMSAAAAHRSMLQNLFRPPTDITFIGSFEAVKEVASETGKWLLVNVQDVKEFACQTLNRDIWSNDGVKELIRTNFVFWQVRHDSVDGQRLNNYYRIKSYPAIFILDPRTGELVQNLVMKKQDPVTLCDLLASHLDKFPDYYAHDRFLKGSSESAETDAFDPGNVPEYAAEPECSRSIMFEDDEMDRISRKRKGENGHSNGKKARVEYVDVLNEPTRMLSVVDRDEWRQETARTGEMIRIRLKLPDGRMETIEIMDNSKLKALFVLIAGRNLTPKEHNFVLSFPRREFSVEDADRTLKMLGFSRNEMVHVELK